jgi:hypothetical protein
VSRFPAFVVVLLAAAVAHAAGRDIKVLLIVPPAASSVVAGAQMGAAEADRTAKLFDRAFHLTIETVRTPAEAIAVVRRTKDMFVIAGGGRRDLSDAIATTSRVPFLEIGPPGKQVADSRFRLSPESGVAWHPDLKRYGAGELNERYLRHSGIRMTADAWAGWLAMKLALEAALKGKPIESMRLDGHKGVLLRFDERRVLQQPVYRVDQDGKLLDR